MKNETFISFFCGILDTRMDQIQENWDQYRVMSTLTLAASYFAHCSLFPERAITTLHRARAIGIGWVEKLEQLLNKALAQNDAALVSDLQTKLVFVCAQVVDTFDYPPSTVKFLFIFVIINVLLDE